MAFIFHVTKLNFTLMLYTDRSGSQRAINAGGNLCEGPNPFCVKYCQEIQDLKTELETNRHILGATRSLLR